MNSFERTVAADGAHERPTVANWSHGASLKSTLILAVAASAAVVIGGVTLVGMRIAERLLDSDVRDTARLTAVAVADEVELRPDVDPPGIVPVLHEFMAAAPSLRTIS